jgi:hypothetical protein
MIGSLFLKPEFFEVESEFIDTYGDDTSNNNNTFLPIYQSLYE